MNIHEEFGDYLLLKKLREDPLGETYRAGKLGAQGLERVVLLRVMNGAGLRGGELWDRISHRKPLQDALDSPNLGEGVDLGVVQGVLYVAYDYISGNNLSMLADKARREGLAIPVDQALLIAERIALGLAMAYETRFQNQRLLHGFVVPPLVMVSNEGETRLLGFEVAPGLRELVTRGEALHQFSRYLPAEALTGSPPSKADDVYSLGVILYELLTGQALPTPTPAGHADLLAQAKLAGEGSPLPPEVVALLGKTLVSREQRIADVVTWHKALSKLMIDGGYTATTFNLAFFMHNLFRDEIERESQEIETEKTMEFPARVPGSDPAATVAIRRDAGLDRAIAGAAPARPAAEARPEAVQAPPDKPAPKKRGMLLPLAAVLALAVLGGGGYYYFFVLGGGLPTGETVAPPPPIAQPDPSLDAAVPPAGEEIAEEEPPPAGPSPEEIQAQIDAMIEARSKDLAKELQSQYDSQIKRLQQELEETRKVAEEGSRARAQMAALETEPEAAPPRGSAPPPAAGGQTPSRTTPSQPPAGGEAAVPPPSTQPPPPPTPVTQPPPPPAPVTQPPPPPPPPPPREPPVRLGDLVTMGPGVIPPKLIKRYEPRYPPMARRLNRQGRVEVRVLVDETGKVTEAELSGEKAGFGFDEAALDAAGRSTFQPATKEGVRVKMWTQINFDFKL